MHFVDCVGFLANFMFLFLYNDDACVSSQSSVLLSPVMIRSFGNFFLPFSGIFLSLDLADL